MDIKITVAGKQYPCRQTMGAMLRFRRETGREVTEIDAGNISDLFTFLWCCIKSASKADGVEFPLSLLDFADSITPDEAAAWTQSLQAAEAADADGEEADTPAEGKKN